MCTKASKSQSKHRGIQKTTPSPYFELGQSMKSITDKVISYVYFDPLQKIIYKRLFDFLITFSLFIDIINN